jgi:excisionase family DNA binding protein
MPESPAPDWADCPAILTSKEAAALLRCDMKTFYQYARMADFPSLDLGKKIRVSRDGLRSWVERRTKRLEAV